MANKQKKKKKRKSDGEFRDPHVIFRGPPTGYELSYMPEYDTVNDEPYMYVGRIADASSLEKKRFGKVYKPDRLMFLEMWDSTVASYWENNHLIPQDSVFSTLRDKCIKAFAQEVGHSIKVDSAFNRMLLERMVRDINNNLKANKDGQPIIKGL